MPKKGETKRVPWVWTKVRLQVCQMLAEGVLKYAQIAQQTGVGERTIYKWLDIPEFRSRRDGFYRQYEDRIMRSGIAVKANRVNYLQSLHERQHQIVEARSVELVKAVGGKSGLIAVEERMAGYGDTATLVTDEVFDAGLSRELRATLEQAAKEAGQSVDKHEVSGPDGKPIEVSIGVLDDIVARVRAAREANGAGGSEPGQEDNNTE